MRDTETEKRDGRIMNKKIKRLLTDTVVLAMGTFASKLLVFLMLPLYTEYLTPGMYSTADLITQAANLIIPFACLGMTDAVFRFVSEKQTDKGAVLSSGLFILLIGVAAFGVLSPVLALFSKFDGYVWLIVVYVIAADIHSLFAQYIRAQGRTRLFAVQGIVNTAFTIGLNILFLVVFKMNITGYVLSTVVADLLSTVFIIAVSRPLKDIKLSLIRKDLIREMLKYCLPLIPTTIFWWITNVSDRYIVSEICGDSVNGLYAAAYKIPTLLTLASAVFNEAWQYFAFSGKRSKGEDRESEKTPEETAREERENSYYFERTFAAFSTVMMLACSFLMLLCKPLINILLADSYRDAWIYVPILLVATVFTALVTFLSSTYALRKKTVMSLVTAAVGAVVNIVFNILLIPVFGANGAAFATLLCYALVFVIRSVNVRKYVKFRIYKPTFIISTAVLAAQCASIVVSGEYNIIFQSLFVCALIAVNIPTIFSTLKAMFLKN